MTDIDEIRRANLRTIETEFGGPAGAASRLGMSTSQFINLRNGARDSKTGKPRGMRKETARRIERAAEKPVGWLDTSHEDASTAPLLSPTEAQGGTDAAYPGAPLTPSANIQNASTPAQSRVVALSAWPFRRIDPARLLALPAEEQAFIEGQLLAAINDAETRIGKPPASDAQCG